MKKFEYMEDEKGNLQLCIVSDKRFNTLSLINEKTKEADYFAIEIDDEMEKIMRERYFRK